MPRATPKSSAAVPRALGVKPFPRPVGQDANELMELAVDAAQSRHLPEFLERFASRAARMLDAAWWGVAVVRGRETDLYQANPEGITLEAGAQKLREIDELTPLICSTISIARLPQGLPNPRPADVR